MFEIVIKRRKEEIKILINFFNSQKTINFQDFRCFSKNEKIIKMTFNNKIPELRFNLLYLRIIYHKLQ